MHIRLIHLDFIFNKLWYIWYIQNLIRSGNFVLKSTNTILIFDINSLYVPTFMSWIWIS